MDNIPDYIEKSGFIGSMALGEVESRVGTNVEQAKKEMPEIKEEELEMKGKQFLSHRKVS